MDWRDILAARVGDGSVEVGAGASEVEIAAAEAMVGAFPDDYRSFLSRFGYASIGPHEIFGLGGDVPAYLNVAKLTLDERRDSPGLPAAGIVFFNDGGGNLRLFKGGEIADPAVYRWFHGEDDPIEAEYESFGAWLLAILSDVT